MYSLIFLVLKNKFYFYKTALFLQVKCRKENKKNVIFIMWEYS